MRLAKSEGPSIILELATSHTIQWRAAIHHAVNKNSEDMQV